MKNFLGIAVALMTAFSFTTASAQVVWVAEDFDGTTVGGGLIPSGGLTVTTVADPSGAAGMVGQVDITGGGQWQSLISGTTHPLPANTVVGVDTVEWSYRVYVPSTSVYTPAGDNVGSIVRVNGTTPDAFPPTQATPLNVDFPLDTWVTITAGSGLVPEFNNIPGTNPQEPDLTDPTTGLLPILSLRVTGNATADTITSGTHLYIDDISVGVTESNVTAPLLGDVNLDGTVTFLDIAPFIALLSTQGFQLEADINLDESVTFLDIQPFIDILAGQPQ